MVPHGLCGKPQACSIRCSPSHRGAYTGSMVILLWVAFAVVVANAFFAAFLLIRFRAEENRAAAMRDGREESAHWDGSGGSSRGHLA